MPASSRLWLIGAFAAVAACSQSSKPAEAPKGATGEAAGAGKSHAFQIGALSAFALQDGELAFPNDGKILALDHSPGESSDLLAAAGQERDSIHLSIQPLLVKLDGRVALFDTGSGGAFPNSGWLLRALATTGVAPGGVTDIFISHAHPDHTGGLVDRSGALVFPAATVHLSAPEWAAMQQNAEVKAITAAITPKVVAFEPGAKVIPGVQAVSTTGHTPGHSSYEISSGSEKLFYLGDLAHHSIISVQRPAWSIQFDMDHAAAEATRQKTLAALAADHERVYAVHFPFPGIGRVTAKGDSLAWQPE